MNALQALRQFTPAIKSSPSSFLSHFASSGGMDIMIKLTSFSTQRGDLNEAFLLSIKAMLDSPYDVGFNII